MGSDEVNGSQSGEIKGQRTKPPTKYKKKKLSNEFFTSDGVLRECADIIDQLLDRRLVQEEMDDVYKQFVDMYHTEMSKFMKEIDMTKKSKKATRHTRKAYWDEELSSSWNDFHEAKKAFL